MSDEYADDDLVYVDPENRKIIGPVEWTKDGKVKPLVMKEKEDKETEETKEKKSKPKRRSTKKRYYPWGTFRSVKKLYNTHGKTKEVENYKSFDTALQKALKEPFWD